MTKLKAIFKVSLCLFSISYCSYLTIHTIFPPVVEEPLTVKELIKPNLNHKLVALIFGYHQTKEMLVLGDLYYISIINNFDIRSVSEGNPVKVIHYEDKQSLTIVVRLYEDRYFWFIYKEKISESKAINLTEEYLIRIHNGHDREYTNRI